MKIPKILLRKKKEEDDGVIKGGSQFFTPLDKTKIGAGSTDPPEELLTLLRNKKKA